MFKRINKPLTKNGTELFAVGDTCNEIIGDSVNWEKVNESVWDLKFGDKFWIVNLSGEPSWGTWDENSLNVGRRNRGLVFLTKEDAEEYSWRLEFETKMRKEFKSDEVDWNNTNHYKHFVMYDHNDKEASVWSSRYGQYQCAICCSNLEVVEQFIEENESDLLRYFGVVRR